MILMNIYYTVAVLTTIVSIITFNRIWHNDGVPGLLIISHDRDRLKMRTPPADFKVIMFVFRLVVGKFNRKK